MKELKFNKLIQIIAVCGAAAIAGICKLREYKDAEELENLKERVAKLEEK